jgi:hypothetical protein
MARLDDRRIGERLAALDGWAPRREGGLTENDFEPASRAYGAAWGGRGMLC